MHVHRARAAQQLLLAALVLAAAPHRAPFAAAQECAADCAPAVAVANSQDLFGYSGPAFYYESGRNGVGNLTALPCAFPAGAGAIVYRGNPVRAVDAAAFAGQSDLGWLELTGSDELEALPDGLFAGLRSLVRLHLHGNRLSALAATAFQDLGSLEHLQLQGNRLGALPGGLFDALANLLALRLENNRIPALPAGLFAATTRLQFLWLHGNLIATAPSALLAGLPGGLRGRTGYGRPRLLLAPNPLVCRPSSGENLWSAAARDDAVRCSGCAQGYEAGAGSSAGHVSCVRPPFQPNPGPNSTVQRALASIRSVLARRSNGTVFLGEPLDPYAAADAADAADAAAAPVRSFEPKRDNFLGYATAAGASFDDVRFSAALTDLDISCGDVVVGDLTNARRSVPSAIAVPTSFAGSVPTRLFTTPQRYLRFRVLRAGGARFSFDACGSRFGATIAVYSATTTAPSGGGGGGGGDRRRDIVAGGTDDFYQGSLAGMDGSLADTLLPTRSGCPMGASGRLDNVTLPPGTYEVAVQQHPSATALPAGDAVFEVAMACDPATHSAANPAAMPVDPSRGGIAIDAVTGRLAVAPPADLAAALHGRYNLSIFAEDGAGVRVSMTTPPIEITLAERPPFAVRDAATSISAGCAAELARIRDRTSTLPYHHGQPTGVDGFNRDLCANRGLFAHYFADDEAGVSFQLRMRGAGATGPTTMRDAYASAETGRILIRPPPAAAPGTTADFVAVLQAVDGRGSRVNVSVWNVSVVDVPPLPIVRAVGGGTTGGPTTATATAYTTAADGSLSLSRTRWAIGTTYQLPSLSLVFADDRAPADAPVSFKLEPPQPGFFINTETGEVLGRPVAPSGGGARPPTAAQSTMYAVAEGFAPTALGTFTFEFLPADVDVVANGPGNRRCIGGDPVDAVEFDNNFTCSCYDGFEGSNCDATVMLEAGYHGAKQVANSSAEYTPTSRQEWAIGTTYRLAPANVTSARTSAGAAVDVAAVAYQLDPNPPGFFIDGSTGEILGKPEAAGSYTSTLYATSPGTQRAALVTLTLEFLPADVDSADNGPGNRGCAHGAAVDDAIEFNGVFGCDCAGTSYRGDTCNISTNVMCEYGEPTALGDGCWEPDCPDSCTCDVPTGNNNVMTVTCTGASVPTRVPAGTGIVDLRGLSLTRPEEQLGELELSAGFSGSVLVSAFSHSAGEAPDRSAGAGTAPAGSNVAGACPRVDAGYTRLPLQVCPAGDVDDCQECPLGQYGLADGSSCRPCARGGFFSATPGRIGPHSHCPGACDVCPDGTFASVAGAADIRNCTVCPEGTNTTGPAGYRACRCLSGRARTDRLGPCDVQCDAAGGITCPREFQELLPGYYWAFESGDEARELYSRYAASLQLGFDYDRDHAAFTGTVPRAYECPRQESCLGGTESACAEGYAGPLCMVCAEGHVNTFGECQACTPGAASWGLLVVFGSLLAYGLWRLWVKPVTSRSDLSPRGPASADSGRKPGLATVIFEDHYVVLSQTITIYPFVNFSPASRAFLTAIQYVAQPFSAAYGLGCLLPAVSAHDQLLVFMALPAVNFVLVCSYAAVQRHRIGTGRAGDLTADRLHINCVGILLKSMPTLLVYMIGKATAVLRPCHDVAGTEYMYADYAVACDETHATYRMVATVALIAAAILVGFTFLKIRSAHAISTAVCRPVWVGAVVFISEAYSDGQWHWRFVDFGRVVCMTSAVELLWPDSIVQLFGAILITLAFLQLDGWVQAFLSRPHASAPNRTLYSYALTSVMLVQMWVALLHSGLQDAAVDPDSLQLVVTIAIICSVLLPYARLGVDRIAQRRRAAKPPLDGVGTAARPPPAMSNPMFARDAVPVPPFWAVSADSADHPNPVAGDVPTKPVTRRPIEPGNDDVGHASRSDASDRLGPGDRVSVVGYGGAGVVRFVGAHHRTGKPRVGVELDAADGKNTGTVAGHRYFDCAEAHGLLVAPTKVLRVPPPSPPAAAAAPRASTVSSGPGATVESIGGVAEPALTGFEVPGSTNAVTNEAGGGGYLTVQGQYAAEFGLGIDAPEAPGGSDSDLEI